MSKPLQILNKQEAFDSVFDDAVDVAHDDSYNLEYDGNYNLAKSGVSEFKAYMDALDRIKHDPNNTKYIQGDGFPASYALFLQVDHKDYVCVKRLYNTYLLGTTASQKQIAKSNYVFHDPKVRHFIQPLIDILKNKRKHPVKIASKSNIVRFDGNVDPLDKHQAYTILINRLMLIKDEYETVHNVKEKQANL